MTSRSNVKKHTRKKPNGGRTIVRRHSRKVETKRNSPKKIMALELLKRNINYDQLPDVVQDKSADGTSYFEEIYIPFKSTRLYVEYDNGGMYYFYGVNNNRLIYSKLVDDEVSGELIDTYFKAIRFLLKAN